MRAFYVVALAIVLAGPSMARTLSAQAPAPGPAPKTTGPGSINAWNTAPGGSNGLPGQTNIGWTDLTSAEALDAVKNKGAIFIDVRYPDEFAAAHYPGAVNALVSGRDPKTLKGGVVNTNFVNEVTAAVKGNKDTPIVISCWGGGLSRIGSSLLISAGFKDIKNLYYGFSNHNLWPRFFEDPNGDFKDVSPPIEGKFNAVNNTAVVGLAKTLGVYDSVPTSLTTFIPSDEYLSWVAQLFGYVGPANSTNADYVKFFETNSTAGGQLRASLVYGIVPSLLSADDLKKGGSVDTALPGLKLAFNSSGTRVVTPNYKHTNIFGRTNGLPNSFVLDYPLLPLPEAVSEPLTTAEALKLASTVKPITAAEAQKYVADSLALAAKAKAPTPAPAGRR